ncbi:MAG: hypothetical protein QM767_13415 [Anaeromyxobacter sp.]
MSPPGESRPPSREPEIPDPAPEPSAFELPTEPPPGFEPRLQGDEPPPGDVAAVEEDDDLIDETDEDDGPEATAAPDSAPTPSTARPSHTAVRLLWAGLAAAALLCLTALSLRDLPAVLLLTLIAAAGAGLAASPAPTWLKVLLLGLLSVFAVLLAVLLAATAVLRLAG